MSTDYPAEPGSSDKTVDSFSTPPTDTPIPPSDSQTTAEKLKGKGGKGRVRHGPRDESPDVKISKTLSYILRHGAAKEHLVMRPDGYIRVDDLLARPKLKDVDLLTLKRIVAENAKQRFALNEEADPSEPSRTILWIRANQGHSLEVEELQFEQITSADQCPVVVHGTFMKFWPAIRSEGLKLMTRHHIHCASGLYGEQGVTSGMRASCDVFIYVNVEKALQDGIVFEKSANGVILTKGQEGTLKPVYFKKVLDKKGQPLS